MPKPKPLVTVYIPTYNCEDYIEKTLKSVLNQTYKNLEIIISDDKSTDSTLDIISKVKDKRVKIIKNRKNKGLGGNWNRCFPYISGKYFKLLPNDDLLYPDCIEKQVDILERNKNCELVFSKRDIIDKEDNIIFRRSFFSKSGELNADSLRKKSLLMGTNIIGEPGCGLLRSDTVKKIGQYSDNLVLCIDLDYWFRILDYGNAYYQNESLATFRVSSYSTSFKIRDAQYRQFLDFLKRYRHKLGITFFQELIAKLCVMKVVLMKRVFYIYIYRKYKNT